MMENLNYSRQFVEMASGINLNITVHVWLNYASIFI